MHITLCDLDARRRGKIPQRERDGECWLKPWRALKVLEMGEGRIKKRQAHREIWH